MKKTYVVTITLSYDDVQNAKALKTAVHDEAVSWVSSGSFDEDLYYDGPLDYDVEIKETNKHLVGVAKKA